jgi:hypothetical protein
MKDHAHAVKAAAATQLPEEPDASERLREKLIESSLCVNCKHLGDCIYPAKAAAAILECELYECGPAASPRLIVVKAKQHSSDESPGLSEDEALGLCANCESLPHCRLPKNPGGVWHCEEYE